MGDIFSCIVSCIALHSSQLTPSAQLTSIVCYGPMSTYSFPINDVKKQYLVIGQMLQKLSYSKKNKKTWHYNPIFRCLAKKKKSLIPTNGNLLSRSSSGFFYMHKRKKSEFTVSAKGINHNNEWFFGFSMVKTS